MLYLLLTSLLFHAICVRGDDKDCYKQCPNFIAVKDYKTNLPGVWINAYQSCGYLYTCTVLRIKPEDRRLYDVQRSGYQFTQESVVDSQWKLENRNGYYLREVNGVTNAVLYSEDDCMLVSRCSEDPRTKSILVILNLWKKCNAQCNMDKVKEAIRRNKLEKLPLTKGYDSDKCPGKYGAKNCKVQDFPAD